MNELCDATSVSSSLSSNKQYWVREVESHDKKKKKKSLLKSKLLLFSELHVWPHQLLGKTAKINHNKWLIGFIDTSDQTGFPRKIVK